MERANHLASKVLKPLRQRVQQLTKDLASAEEEGERALRSITESGVGDNDLARRFLRENEQRRRQLRGALNEAEGELAARETEHLDPDTVRQALQAFDEVWEALEPAEQRDLLRCWVPERRNS